MKPLLLAAVLLATAVSPAFATNIEKRIQFAPGKSSATVTGTVADPVPDRPGEVRDRYLVKARKGQRLVVKLEASLPTMVIVWHDDYNKGYLGDKTGTRLSLPLKLPANDDYVIDVERTPDVRKTNYKLTVEIR
jgi:hypothetical protein